MTDKNVTNHSESALGLPNGPVIQPGATVRVNDWENKESNDVVKAWLDAGALTLEDAPERDESKGDAGDGKGERTDLGVNPPVADNNPDGTGEPNGGAGNVNKTEEQLRAMTKADLSKYIETDLGGEVKSTMDKDDLVRLALDLQA